MAEEEKASKSKKINKEILNIIRTTMRNNIELTHLADNKANVLLSLNALMITFLTPFVMANIEVIKQFKLAVPLAILVLTCFITIYIAALVLKPCKFFDNKERLKEGGGLSPFFFGNFYKMKQSEFQHYIKQAVADTEDVKLYVTEDLHYIGTRLGQKMALIRLAFNIFILGFFGAISIGSICLFMFAA